MIVIEGLQQTVQVKCRSRDSTQVEDLMRAAPYVEESGTNPLRNAQLYVELANHVKYIGDTVTYCVDDSSTNVTQTLAYKEPPTHLAMSLFDSKGLCRMGHWERS